MVLARIKKLLPINNPQLELITVPNQLRRVHAFDGRRQGGDLARHFRSKVVADAVLAAGERGDRWIFHGGLSLLPSYSTSSGRLAAMIETKPKFPEPRASNFEDQCYEFGLFV